MTLPITGYTITKIITCLIASIVLFITSFNCRRQPLEISDPLERNLVFSGSNREELEKVIAHFKKDPDSLKLKATIFLLSNMDDKIHYKGDWLRQADSLFFTRAGDLEEEGLQQLRDTVFDLIGTPDQGDIRNIYDLRTLSSSFHK